jgi:hypothetical protein
MTMASSPGSTSERREASLIQSALLSAQSLSWPDFENELVERAKQSAIGRRMLANALAKTAAPHLFGSLEHLKPNEHAGWMALDEHSLDARILDLGALLFADAIRSTVVRQALQVLRSAIGETRYAMILKADLSDVDHAWQKRAKTLFNAALNLPTSLEPLLRTEGAQELFNLLEHEHPMLRERVRLLYPRVFEGLRVRLSRALLQQYLLDLPVASS